MKLTTFLLTTSIILAVAAIGVAAKKKVDYNKQTKK